LKKTFFKKFAAVQREIPALLNGLYKACTKLGDLSVFDRYYEPPLNVASPDELNKIGYVCIENKEWRRAIEYFEKVVAIPGKKSSVAMMYLARAYGMEGNHDLCIHWLKTGREFNPLNHELWAELGTTYMKLEEYDKARQCYETFLQNSSGPVSISETPQLYQNLTKLMETNNERLVELLKRIVRCDKTAWGAWSCLGDAYFKMGRVDDALEAYRTIISHDHGYIQHEPVRSLKSSKWSKRFVRVCRTSGQISRVAETYKSVIKRVGWTANSASWDDLHIACFMQNDTSDLIGFYRMALAKNPYRGQLWLRLGDVYFATSEFALAIKAYRGTVKLEPRLDSVRIRLGLAYE
jgi:tetratricopeptide (TPR) repeat protein